MTDTTIATELKTHGIYASNTLGVSMEPLFRTHRDMIVVKRPESELKKYDVALYVTPKGKYILHRVIRVRDDEYIFRGDNTYAPENVPKEWVIGVLVQFNRKGRSHSVSDRSYRVYSRVWCFIYPLRFVYIKLRTLGGRIFRKIFHKRGSTK